MLHFYLQHEVVDAMVELASFVVYVVDGFLVDADEHRVRRSSHLTLDKTAVRIV